MQDTPAVVLYDATGIQTAISGNTTAPNGTKGYIFGGIDSSYKYQFLRVSNDGTLFVTGTFSIDTSVTQSVWLSNPTASISNFPATQSVLLSNPTASISNFPATQSVLLVNPTASISNFPATQSVWLSNPTASISNFPATQSVLVGNTVVTAANPVCTVKNYIRPDPYFATQFGEFATAHKKTFLDLVNQYGFDSTYLASGTVGGGTVTDLLQQSAIRLSVNTGSTDLAQIRTHEYFKYQAGREMNLKITCYHDSTGSVNQIRRWGYFDTNDGLFFAVSGSNFGFYRRCSATGVVSESFFSQSVWNVDKLDGTGPSGLVLNKQKANLYEIRFEWLGVGNIMLFVDNTYVHEIVNANEFNHVYMRTGQLPIQLQVENIGAASTGSMTFICANVSSTGGDNPYTFSYTAFKPNDAVITATEVPVLAIRVSSSINGLVNRSLVLPTRILMSQEGSTNAKRGSFRVIYNPTTLTTASNAVWIPVGSGSAVEYTLSASAWTGGTTVHKGFLPTQYSSTNDDLRHIFNWYGRKMRLSGYSNTPDVLVITALDDAGGAGNILMRPTLTWDEIK